MPHSERYPEFVEIYGSVEAIAATKTHGMFRGGKNRGGYRHDFTKPTRAIGLGARALVTFPSGRTIALQHRTTLLIGNHNVWGYRTHS